MCLCIDSSASFGLRVITMNLPFEKSPPHGCSDHGVCVLKTRRPNAGSAGALSISSHIFCFFAGSPDVCAIENSRSTHGDCTIGSYTLLASPSASSSSTICCIQVVPHL